MTDAVTALFERIADAGLLVRRMNLTAEHVIDENFVKPEKINIDKFCKVQMQIKDFTAVISGTKLTAQGKPITTQKSNDCEIC